ncbi:hypothetical protein [Lysinibacillus sp. fls2-241-R2A-57]|uniref:hypothetical protein n=1 Tax=Lysinibacillus sp. fls2-241-R2A-57 TaxID=3040292 RepID=UPI002553AE85|nr:hypothetical protein [Lysinibacillus sp. fls2-241-R2A-57]
MKRLIGRPQEALLCTKAKRQRTNVLSVRKQSVSNKAPSRNGNQPHIMVMNLDFCISLLYFDIVLCFRSIFKYNVMFGLLYY